MHTSSYMYTYITTVYMFFVVSALAGFCWLVIVFHVLTVTIFFPLKVPLPFL
uniref:Uncharacterized protein n=1 Tax=Arundo donax TaxID=35708 RepID=A0A0A9FBQ1_ARUDO